MGKESKGAGERVKLLRVLAGLKQEVIAFIANTSQKSVAAIEAGAYAPNLQVREKLSTLFSVNEYYLLTGTGKIFTSQIVYFCPVLLLLKTPKKYGEVEKVLNTLLPNFINKAAPEKIFQVELISKGGMFYTHAYVMKISDSLMFIDVMTFPKLVFNIFQSLKIPCETIKIEQTPKETENFPPRLRLIYSFLRKIQYPDYQKKFDEYVEESINRINFKKTAIMEGISSYVYNTLNEHLIDITEFINFLNEYANKREI